MDDLKPTPGGLLLQKPNLLLAVLVFVVLHALVDILCAVGVAVGGRGGGRGDCRITGYSVNRAKRRSYRLSSTIGKSVVRTRYRPGADSKTARKSGFGKPVMVFFPPYSCGRFVSFAPLVARPRDR